MAGCILAAPPRRRNISRSVRQRILAENPCCAYCRELLTDRNRHKATIDHVIPVSRGGLNLPGNLLVACGCCNRAKANRTLAEWAADILAAMARIEERQAVEPSAA